MQGYEGVMRQSCNQIDEDEESSQHLGSPRSSLLCDLCTIARENLVFLRGSFFADTPLRRQADTVVLFGCGFAALFSLAAIFLYIPH
jgi:hypothetical protein